jgi:tRNA threonylcarbamoyladenosine biosynthesis protein TsaB
MLFIDSTYNLTLGLLDEGYSWLELAHHAGQKSSAILQKEVYSVCSHHNLKLKDVEGIISIAGPGFYTGLRLSEGFADILKFMQIPNYSFYSYEIPFWLGHEEGVWMTKAYRGEYFFHHWKGEDSYNKLVTNNELPDYMASLDKVFIHSPTSMDELSLGLVKSFDSTFDLLKASPEAVFKKVVELKLNRDSYYFRAPEDEFRVSP